MPGSSHDLKGKRKRPENSHSPPSENDRSSTKYLQTNSAENAYLVDPTTASNDTFFATAARTARNETSSSDSQAAPSGSGLNYYASIPAVPSMDPRMLQKGYPQRSLTPKASSSQSTPKKAASPPKAARSSSRYATPSSSSRHATPSSSSKHATPSASTQGKSKASPPKTMTSHSTSSSHHASKSTNATPHMFKCPNYEAGLGCHSKYIHVKDLEAHICEFDPKKVHTKFCTYCADDVVIQLPKRKGLQDHKEQECEYYPLKWRCWNWKKRCGMDFETNTKRHEHPKRCFF